MKSQRSSPIPKAPRKPDPVQRIRTTGRASLIIFFKTVCSFEAEHVLLNCWFEAKLCIDFL